MSPILAPDGSTSIFAFIRDVEGVYDCGDDHDQPGNDGTDLVGYDGFPAKSLTLGERIVCIARLVSAVSSPWGQAYMAVD
jgi:hypothetical protein